jgi:prepilin signal peptidase PulO-like enzyme (type II secretory pathway)
MPAGVAFSFSVIRTAFAAAVFAPLAAFGGLWVARATDPALARISVGLRPSSIAVASGLGVGIALAAPAATMPGLLICGLLAGAGATDRDRFVLPDILTFAAVALALAFRPFTPSASRLQLLVAGGGLYGLGIAFAWAMRAWRGRAAFGQGDVKLIAGLGMILPAGLIGPAILAGAVSALASAWLPARGPARAIPLGIHMVVGTAVALGAAAVLSQCSRSAA